MIPLILNFDDSVAAQAAIAARVTEIVDLTSLRNDLRLSASSTGLNRLRQHLQQLRIKYPNPWLTFLGSGDFHHIALALIESLAKEKHFHLILIDNHPDWFCERPTFHCGNWVSGALEHVESATLIGQNSPDLRPIRFRRAPFDHLCDGRLKFYPHSLESVLVPFKYPAKVYGSAVGTRLAFDTLIKFGAFNIFSRIASDLAGENIYLSVDKDVLRASDAVTDWEQGELSLPDLVAGIGTLRAHCTLIGADICGDHSPHPLHGLWKRLDAQRWKSEPKPEASRINECANLAILSAISPEPSPSPIPAAASTPS